VQLDRTTIAIRERGLLDTLDLSLHVLRIYALPLITAMGLGVIPLMVVNHLLLDWMIEPEDEELIFPFRFVWHMSVQIFLQAQLASVFATAYLGEAVFLERPKLLSIVVKVAKMAPRIIWCQVLLRGVAPALLILLTIERYSGFEFFLEGFTLAALVIYVAAMRAFRPFMNEIVLLERNPLTSRSSRVMTVGKRSSMLHGPSGGDLFFRWCGSALIGICLLLSIYVTFLFVAGVFFQDWTQSVFMVRFCLPLSMWITALYFTVSRFLTYLDVRIRQEGWEVELRLRAEAYRMANRLM
jgi:hypothetical protein